MYAPSNLSELRKVLSLSVRRHSLEMDFFAESRPCSAPGTGRSLLPKRYGCLAMVSFRELGLAIPVCGEVREEGEEGGRGGR